jgi:hypothetical protein
VTIHIFHLGELIVVHFLLLQFFRDCNTHELTFFIQGATHILIRGSGGR